jgi:DNA-binding winged helix-turn-helix (wHTH) protein
MTRCIYHSGDCRVDPVARELWRGGRLVELPPQVFDCLAYLVEHHDRAVGRDELVAAVWGRTEVSDTLLGQTMLRIRRELGDDGKEQRIVRTIPRFGYRWVAPLEAVAPGDGASLPVQAVVADDAPGSATAVEPIRSVDEPLGGDVVVASARAQRRPWLVPIVLAGIVVLLVITAGALRREAVAPAEPMDAAATGASITAAVVPAEIEAGNDWSWLRFGVMDVVATRLRSAGVPTVPSENIVALLNRPSSLRNGSLRDAAGFTLLVSPRASRSGGGWRVHLDAEDGAGQRRVAEASALDAAEAARLATDQLLVALGRKAPAAGADAAPYAELIRRVDAAILADDPATARALIEQTPASEQTSAELRLRLAKIDFRGGRIEAARTRLLGLLDEASAQTVPLQRAAVLNGLGAVAIRSDQPQQAESYFAEAVDLLIARSEPAQLGVAYLGRAGAAKEQHHFEAASADYSRARIALRQANDTLALVRVAANEGFLDLDQGRPAQALAELATASRGFEQWGALNEAIYTYIGQIGCQLALLEPAKAMDAADAAAPLALRIDNQDTRDSLDIARAQALVANGRLREARETLGRLRDASRADGVATSAAAAVPMAQLEFEDALFPSAARIAATAIDVLVQPAYAHMRAQAWLIEVRALSRASGAAATLAQVDAFAAWAERANDHRATLYAQLARAEYAWRFGNGRQWHAQFEQARMLAEQRAVPADLARVASAYADALIAEGDLQTAEVEVGRLARWADHDFASAVLEARLYAALGRNEARQTALAQARALAGERVIPADTSTVPISTHEASAR